MELISSRTNLLTWPASRAANLMATDPPKEWPTTQTLSAFVGSAVSTRRA